MELCKKICKDCPFAVGAAEDWLGPYESPEDLHRIVMAERPFPCHLKQDKDLSHEDAGTKRYPLCRGSVAYMRKNAKVPRDPELNEAMGSITKEDKDQVMSVVEFLNHHKL